MWAPKHWEAHLSQPLSPTSPYYLKKLGQVAYRKPGEGSRWSLACEYLSSLAAYDFTCLLGKLCPRKKGESAQDAPSYVQRSVPSPCPDLGDAAAAAKDAATESAWEDLNPALPVTPGQAASPPCASVSSPLK